MNSFLNPITGSIVLKRFLFDPRRIRRLSPQKIHKYRDKAFRKIVTYANTVPLYKKAYKKAGVTLDTIRGIEDITKLPFISKQQLIEHYPEGLLPEGYNRQKTTVVSTGGSSGKPVSLFIDFSVISGGVGASLRLLKEYGVHWRKSKIANVGNFSPGKADAGAQQVFYSKAKSLKLTGNFIFINAFDPMDSIIQHLDDFQPDLILSYPTTFQHLAYLRRRGQGTHINPKILNTSGSVLDNYTKHYVEDTFKSKMLNVYGSTEASSETPVAFECLEGTWHINYDFFNVEAIDEHQELVDEGELGHIVLTRLFGKATPIIRYTGMDDWIRLESDYQCSCGLHTPIIKGGVTGRVSSSILLPDGRLFPAASFANVHAVLTELHTQKIRQFQIIQKKLDEIEIHVVLDEQLRDVDPPVDVLFEKLKEKHQQKAGKNVLITIKEVSTIRAEKNKPAPLVVSKLTEEERKKILP